MSEGRGRLATISALGIVQIFAWGSSYYLPAVLIKPIAASTGWPLAAVTGGFSIALLASGLLSPRVGRMIRARGGRDVLIGGLVLLAVGLAILAAAPTLPVYFLGWLVMGSGMSATLYDAAFGTLGRYYGYGARSAITTLTLYGGFASTICWPLSAFLLDHGGWRAVCLVYAAVHLIVGVPLIWRFLPPVDRIAAGGDRSGSETEVGQGDVPERLAFWLLAAIVTLGGTLATVVSVHLIAILEARDVSLAVAVSLGALIGPSQVGARVFDMAIGKRFPAIATLAFAAFLIAAGVLALASGLPALALALILYGAGNGIWSIARGAVPLALFGPDRFPVMMGKLAMPTLVAQSLAPPASAVLLQHAGAGPLTALVAGAAVVNVILVGFLWRATATRPGLASHALAPSPPP